MTRRNTKGQFVKGLSGNPAGRPRTSLGHRVRERVAAHLDELVDLLLDKAREGDVQAARTLLERCAPSLRPEEAAVQVAVPPGADLTATGRALIDAAVAGEVAPGQAAALVGAVGAVARVVETDELIRRIEQLEEQARGSKF